ncbi:MAG: AMP-binding protein [Armatimonadota bacterium]|nr:AMP-binding protein [Armatimonadota bacterium]MDR7455199.1 AMP-binding protein [Armatimonadota bacterium]MDR7456523.1 AMP-binding protein [Armatimonadota bacterium]MDR7495836.1 AMP-binding protein [Armatimonadota bacterium]MDR7511610.1 AMP-binding protein [Armatimonadota bacterium]
MSARAVLDRPHAPVEAPAALDTFPKRLLANAGRFGDRVAFREKELGVWREITWRQYLDRARACALGLHELGVRRSDVVALVGDNRPELYYMAMGAQAIGAISCAFYQDSLAEQLAELIAFAGARVVFCEDQEQTDKILETLDRLPQLEWIVVEDWRGMWRYRHPRLLAYEDLAARGAEAAHRAPERFEHEVAAGRGEEIAILCQTSGTTAMPKLAMLSHDNLLSQSENFHAVEPHISARDEFVSYLPFAWIGEQMISYSLHQLVGFTVNFPEEPETAQRDLREIGPQFTFAPARIYEGLHSAVTVRMLDAGRLRQAIYRAAMRVGIRAVELEAEGRPVPLGLRLARRAAYWTVYRPILDKIGLSRMRVAWNGGASLGPDYFKFFRAMGLNLKQIYGQTEIAGISCVHRDGQVRFWTMGAPIANTEVQLTPEGEIIERSPSVFRGYYRNPEATARALRDGWLYSGDYGALDPTGDVIMFDRMGDVLQTAGGVRVAPRVIEDMLKFTPYIQEAMVVGDGQPFLAAILNIDLRNVGKWAEDRGLAYTSYTDLSQKPEVLELLRRLVAETNTRLQPEWRLRRFVSLYKEFHPDDDELTRTRKLRRGHITDRYRDLIAAIYGGQPTFQATFTVRYEDGRTAEIRPVMRIVAADE